MPIWLYVSITGVIVYFMLYQWYPSTHFDELKKRYELKARSLTLQDVWSSASTPLGLQSLW